MSGKKTRRRGAPGSADSSRYYYLDTIAGTGTIEDPYRPAGAAPFQPGVGALYLRRKGGGREGHCLVSSPVPFKSGLEIGRDLPPHTRRLLANRLGVEPLPDTLSEAALRLLTRDAGPSRWADLQPTHRKRWEVRLGRDLLVSAPVIAGGSFSDDFHRADSTNLGANWDEFQGDAGIVSLRCVNESTSPTSAIIFEAADNNATADIFVQGISAQLGAPTLAATGPLACYNGGVDLDAYFFLGSFRSGGVQLNQISLFELDNGAGSLLDSDTYTLNAGVDYTFRIESSGSSLRALIDTIEVMTGTSTLGLTGKRGGYYLDSSSTEFILLGDYASGDLVVPNADIGRLLSFERHRLVRV